MDSQMQEYFDKMQELSDRNTAQSQAFAREEMEFNKKEAQISRDWQEEMSNTAHQREVADLKAAGLNPVLSANHQGAVTPSGSTAKGSKGDVDSSIVPALSNMVVKQMDNQAKIQMQQAQLSAQLEAARIQAEAQMAAAAQAAAAQKYAADRHFAASQYTANAQKEWNKYGTDKNYEGNILTKGVSPSGYAYTVADKYALNNSGKSASDPKGFMSIVDGISGFFNNLFGWTKMGSDVKKYYK